jgi:hypothetical protein
VDTDTAVLQAAEHVVDQHMMLITLGVDRAIDAALTVLINHVADLETRVDVLEQLLLT